MCEETLILS